MRNVELVQPRKDVCRCSDIGKYLLAPLAEWLEVIFVRIVGKNRAIENEQPRNQRVVIQIIETLNKRNPGLPASICQCWGKERTETSPLRFCDHEKSVCK